MGKQSHWKVFGVLNKFSVKLKCIEKSLEITFYLIKIQHVYIKWCDFAIHLQR